MLGSGSFADDLNLMPELFKDVVKLSVGLGVSELEELAVAVDRRLDGPFKDTVQLAGPTVDVYCQFEREATHLP